MNSRLLIKLVFWIALLSLCIWFVEWRAVLDGLKKIGVSTIAICLLCEWIFIVIESFRIVWLSGRRYSFGIIFRSRILSLFAGLFLPGFASAEILRVFLIDKEARGNKIFIALLLVANRIYGLSAFALVLALGLMFSDSRLLDKLKLDHGWFIAICIFLALAPASLQLRIIRQCGLRIFLYLKGRLRKAAGKLYLATRQFFTGKLWLLTLSTSVLTNLIVIFEFWIFGQQVGIEFDFPTWCLIIPFVSIVNYLPLGIGSFGSQDAALVFVAVALHQAPEPFIAVSLAIHALQILTPLPGLFFAEDLKGLMQGRK